VARSFSSFLTTHCCCSCALLSLMSQPSSLFKHTSTPHFYTLSLHDALPICFIDIHTHADVALLARPTHEPKVMQGVTTEVFSNRSEEHTSELQSPYDLVCRLLLEKK